MKTKTCPRCKQKLSTEKFTTNTKKADGLQTYCQRCAKIYRLEHYRRNKEQHYERNKLTTARIKKKVLDIKNSTCCSDCGIGYIDEPWLMEFDHTSKDKLNHVSILIRKGSLKNVIREIKKCDLVCVLCHRRRTAKRAKWKI